MLWRTRTLGAERVTSLLNWRGVEVKDHGSGGIDSDHGPFEETETEGNRNWDGDF